MKVTLFLMAFLAIFIVGTRPLRASDHLWYVTSPTHGQTYAYGSEQSRTWKTWPPNNHLALAITFDNAPYAEGANQRFDNFTFQFPQVRLGPNGKTFFYHPSSDLALPVAAIHHGWFGVMEVKLLPTAFLKVRKVHGYLTLTLVIGDRPLEENPDIKVGFLH